MEKLVIMDFNTLSVNIYNIDSEVDADEEYISGLGYHPSECSWMVADELEIIHHKGILK